MIWCVDLPITMLPIVCCYIETGEVVSLPSNVCEMPTGQARQEFGRSLAGVWQALEGEVHGLLGRTPVRRSAHRESQTPRLAATC